jgi:hypothetical protein
LLRQLTIWDGNQLPLAAAGLDAAATICGARLLEQSASWTRGLTVTGNITGLACRPEKTRKVCMFVVNNTPFILNYRLF